ncbi:MFS transporter, partial [Francisella tularensis]|nr:MFS transporter [Francisella tularensis]
MIKMYDLIIYALLACYISKILFPIQSAIQYLLIAFSAYAVGYLARTFGVFIFVHFVYTSGRQITSTLSFFFMYLY